jgi:hypothetical protein
MYWVWEIIPSILANCLSTTCCLYPIGALKFGHPIFPGFRLKEEAKEKTKDVQIRNSIEYMYVYVPKHVYHYIVKAAETDQAAVTPKLPDTIVSIDTKERHDSESKLQLPWIPSLHNSQTQSCLPRPWSAMTLSP